MFRSTILLSWLFVVARCELSTTTTTLEFQDWVKQFGKVYHTAEEELHRAKVWIVNNYRITQHNSQTKKTYTMGHNEYSDMTELEFAKFFQLGQFNNGIIPTTTDRVEDDHHDEFVANQRRALLETERLTLPDYVNWIQLGGVTPVKNQGACGSCWAFSTTGALEGAKFVKTGELVALSEQNLLDCDHEDLACNGGLMDNAFKFDEKSGGLCSEADYPYKAKKNPTCNTNCTDVPGSIVKTFIDIPTGNEKALLAAIAMQPISVAIEASTFAFQFYKNGVITDQSCGKAGNIDHGVLAVGYGTDLETNEPYFLVKNSWGATWGDAGYVKLGRTSKNQWGICAILKMASFPITE